MQDPTRVSSLIFTALLSGQLALLAFAVMFERSVPPMEDVSAEVLFAITVFILISGVSAGHFLGLRLLEQARTLPVEEDRLTAGLRAMIVRMALLESVGVLPIVFYLFTGESAFLWLFGVALVALLFKKPSDTEWDSLRRGN